MGLKIANRRFEDSRESLARYQNIRRIRAPIKIKSALPPPNPKYPPPPQNEEFYGHRFSCRKNAFFPGVHKIGAAISGPRIADTNFMDTRIFLIGVFLRIDSCESIRANRPDSRCESPGHLRSASPKVPHKRVFTLIR